MHSCAWSEIASTKRPTTYWAQVFRFAQTSRPDDGGYIGVQTDGLRADGTKGDTAIFSIWNATAAKDGSCTEFGGEGVGLSCRAAITIKPGSVYRTRVWRLDRDPDGNQWWGGWILDEATGIETSLGRIRVSPVLQHIGGVYNFSEYYGPDVGCDGVPLSRAIFRAPTANGGTSMLAFVRSDIGKCTGGRVEPLGAGARIILGGKR